MRHIFLLLILLPVISLGQAKKGEVKKTKKTKDGIELSEVEQDQQEFSYVATKYFQNLVGAQPLSSLGNYVTLDLEKSEIAVDGNILIKPHAKSKTSKQLLTFRFAGGVTEGLSPIYSGGTLSPRFSTSMTYHRVLGQPKTIYALRAMAAYKEKVKEIHGAYEVEVKKLDLEIDLKTLVMDSIKNSKLLVKKRDSLTLVQSAKYLKTTKKEQSELKALDQVITAYKLKISGSSSEIEQYELGVKMKKVQVEKSKLEKKISKRSTSKVETERRILSGIHKLEIEKDEVSNKLKGDRAHPHYKRREWLAQDKDKKLADLKYKSTEDRIEVYGYSFNWLSLGVGLNHKKFNLYDGVLPLVGQSPMDSTSLSSNYFIQFSRFRKRADNEKSFYFNCGIQYSIGDNLDSLPVFKFKQITALDSLNPSQLFRETESSVYDINDYENKLKGLTLYSNIYIYLFERTVGALHVFPDLNFTDNRKASMNVGLGYLMTFTDEEKKSPFNLELYYRFFDLFNANDSTLNCFERGQFGIQINFPFNFKQPFHGKGMKKTESISQS